MLQDIRHFFLIFVEHILQCRRNVVGVECAIAIAQYRICAVVGRGYHKACFAGIEHIIEIAAAIALGVGEAYVGVIERFQSA